MKFGTPGAFKGLFHYTKFGLDLNNTFALSIQELYSFVGFFILFILVLTKSDPDLNTKSPGLNDFTVDEIFMDVKNLNFNCNYERF